MADTLPHEDRIRWEPRAMAKACATGGQMVANAERAIEARPEPHAHKLHKTEHLQFVNSRLKGYDAVTDLFDAFIHLDAEDTLFVYDWRIEQETKLRAERGTGMTDEQVVQFVDAYYPAYELFSDKLRRGLFSGKPRHQLRLIVGKDRKVKEKMVI